MASSVRVTNTPAIKNAPLVGLAEGNGSFSNLQLAAAVLVVPWLVKRVLPIVNRGGFKTYLFIVLLLGVPVTVGYWTLMSMYGRRKNTKVEAPGNDIEEYITIKDPELKSKYHDKEKIPMQEFHDAFFDGKIEFKGQYDFLGLYSKGLIPSVAGDVLDILEQRHDWAKMTFTPELFKYVFCNLIPEVIVHSQSQDEEQVRGHYDREHLSAIFGFFTN
jgi:sphingolipid C9-methyltransferase